MNKVCFYLWLTIFVLQLIIAFTHMIVKPLEPQDTNIIAWLALSHTMMRWSKYDLDGDKL